MVSFDLLRTFLAVYRAESVTRAAGLLGLTQPTVTAQVKTLEASLGRPLFERHARGMAPTAAAAHLAGLVAGPIDELDRRLTADVRRPGDTWARVVHLGGPAELVCTLAVPALAGLVAQGLRLRITLGVPDDLLPALGSGALDTVISTLRPAARRGLRSEPLCDEEFVLVAAPSWASFEGSPSAADLTAVPLLGYADTLPLLRRYWRSVFGTRLTRSPAVVVPDLRGVLAAAVAGCGMTVLPRYLCAAELADGRLHQLLEPAEPPINTLHLVTRTGALAPAVAAVRGTLLAAGRLW